MDDQYIKIRSVYVFLVALANTMRAMKNDEDEVLGRIRQELEVALRNAPSELQADRQSIIDLHPLLKEAFDESRQHLRLP